MPKRLWVLGAPDPEMAAIERLINKYGDQFCYAIMADTLRVYPGSAYKAAGTSAAAEQIDDDLELWWVECAPVGCDRPKNLVDHHRPGDPGYGKQPEDFLTASSIGQVLMVLGALDVVPKEILLVAAADHCLEHAYRGRCPGVDPEELMTWRAASRADFQKRPVSEILSEISAARALLRKAVTVNSHGVYADLRGRSIPELPEAAAREGIPFLASVQEPDRAGMNTFREKVVIQAAPPELVSRFMAGEIIQGLTDVYGDPQRGFAGGYL